MDTVLFLVIVTLVAVVGSEGARRALVGRRLDHRFEIADVAPRRWVPWRGARTAAAAGATAQASPATRPADGASSGEALHSAWRLDVGTSTTDAQASPAVGRPGGGSRIATRPSAGGQRR